MSIFKELPSLERERSRGRDFLAVSVLALVIAGAFFDILFLGNALYLRDLTTYEWPLKNVVRTLLRAGELPHWNPWFAAGQPLAANPAYEVFYPLQWLVLLPDLLRACQIQIVLHLALAAIGMYAFLRSLRLGAGAAFFGALSLAFGGFTLSLLNLLPILFSFAWTPLVLLFTRRYVSGGRRSDLAFGAICLGMQILVGEPATLLQTGILLLAFTWPRAGERRRTFTRLAVTGIAAMGVGAAQLIPVLDLYRDTMRAAGFAPELSSGWSMPLWRPLELFFPEIFGSMQGDGEKYWGARLYGDRGGPFILSIYIGLLPAVLALAGLIAGVRHRAHLIIVVVVSFLLSFGGHTPLFDLLHRIGLFRSMRFPERFAICGLFALVVLAAAALQRLLEGDRRMGRAALLCASGVAGLALVIAAGSSMPAYEGIFQQIWRIDDRSVAALIGMSRAGWWIAFAKGAILVALLSPAARRTRLWLAGAVAFLAADLSPLLVDVTPRISRSFFDPPALAGALPPNRREYRIFHFADWLKETAEGRAYFRTAGVSPYWVNRNGLFPLLPNALGFRTALDRSIDATMLSSTRSIVEVMHRVAQRRPSDWVDRYAAMSNVQVMTDLRPFAEEMRRIRGIEQIQPVMLIRTRPYPRYYFADRVVSIRDASDFIEEVSRETFSPRTAMVEGASLSASPGNVLAVKESASSVTLDVQSDAPGLLVASNSFHRYWSASVDGRATKIRRTNLAYQGLVIPAGRHRVELRYRNPLIIPSLTLSIGTLLLLAFLSTGSLFRGGGSAGEHR